MVEVLLAWRTGGQSLSVGYSPSSQDATPLGYTCTASRTVMNIAIVWAAISEQCWSMCDAMKGMRVDGE
jgi:hypothetical protein